MKLVILVIFAAFIAASVAQQICSYSATSFDILEFKVRYSCKINFVNLNGLNNFTTLGGTHAKLKKDINVDTVTTDFGIADAVGYFASPIIPSIFCTKFKNLAAIQLKASATITSLDSKTFEKCTKLQLLELSDSNLAVLPAGVFDKNKNLQFLSLTSNAVLEIADNAFKSLSKLEYLSLSGNQIEEIEEDWFKDLDKLSYLDLTANNIQEIPELAFENLDKLQTLNMNGNLLTTLNPVVFSPLKSLESVFFGSNKIENIPKETFVDNRKLSMLYIYNNLISYLDAESFGEKTLKNIKSIFASGNLIQGIDEKIFDWGSKIINFALGETECAEGTLSSTNLNALKGALGNCFNNFQDFKNGVIPPTEPIVQETTQPIVDPTQEPTNTPTEPIAQETTETIVDPTQEPTNTPTEPIVQETTETITENPTTVSIQLFCLNKANGNFGHPNDCTKFISCVGGRVYEMNCINPANGIVLYFDPVNNMCVWPWQSTCKI